MVISLAQTILTCAKFRPLRVIKRYFFADWLWGRPQALDPTKARFKRSQTAQNGRLHKTGGTYYQSCMYPTNSAWPAFFTPFPIVLPPSFPRFHCIPNKSLHTLRYTRRHLPSAVPWISEDRLLPVNVKKKNPNFVIVEITILMCIISAVHWLTFFFSF